MWPFPTKRLSAYVSTQGFVAWEMPPATRLQELIISIRDQRQLPSALKRYKTTLRLAPSLGRCYTLQAADSKLNQSELKGLAEYWGKTFMGPHYSNWQWQAMQIAPALPILLCACQSDAEHLKVFQSVKPELLHQADSLKARDSAWVVCSDEALVQSALVIDGTIASIRTWPSHYTDNKQQVIEKHMLLSNDVRGANITYVVESRLGEVKTHGAP